MTLRPLGWFLGAAILAACADSEAANAPPDGVGTDDAVAYEHYVAARDFLERRIGRDDPDSAVARFTSAVEADPDFAEAWAGLSQARMWLHFNQNVPGQVEPAQEAAERAGALDPDGVETRLARGYVAYWGHRDLDAALTEFLAAEELAGDDADVAGAIGNIYRRQGKLDDAVRYYERRVELAPDLEQGLVTLAGTYGAVGRYDGMARVAEQLVEAGDARGQNWRFWAHFHSGDTAAAWAVMPDIKAAWENDGEPDFFDVIQATVRRNDAATLDMMNRMDVEDLGWGMERELSEALARSGEAASRSELFDLWIQDRLEELELEQLSQAAQDAREAQRRSQAARLEALRGNRSAAMEHVARVEELDPLQGDVWIAGGTMWNVAHTYLVLGDANRALDILENLQERDLGSSAAWMELHPALDPVRGTARFNALLAAQRANETIL